MGAILPFGTKAVHKYTGRHVHAFYLTVGLQTNILDNIYPFRLQ